MIEIEGAPQHAPELHRDRQKVMDRSPIGAVPLIVVTSLLLLVFILLVFMPRG
jgi:hypothetical protein